MGPLAGDAGGLKATDVTGANLFFGLLLLRAPIYVFGSSEGSRSSTIQDLKKVTLAGLLYKFILMILNNAIEVHDCLTQNKCTWEFSVKLMKCQIMLSASKPMSLVRLYIEFK